MLIGVVHPDREDVIVTCLQGDLGDSHVVLGLPREGRSPELFAYWLRGPGMDIYNVILFPAIAQDPGWDDWIHDLYGALRRDVKCRVRIVGPTMEHRADWPEVPVAQIWPVEHLPGKLALELVAR